MSTDAPSEPRLEREPRILFPRDEEHGDVLPADEIDEEAADLAMADIRAEREAEKAATARPASSSKPAPMQDAAG